MQRSQKRAVSLLALLPVTALVALTAISPATATGDNRKPEPLVLEKQGSFFVNGKTITTNYTGTAGTPGRIVVNQMYVEYWVPQKKKEGTYPVVMLHGSNHTGKTYGETPDGREGWMTDFLRAGYTVYVVEQVGRARSSFNPTRVNQAKATQNASILPTLSSSSYEGAWDVFRFGPQPDVWHDKIKFPKQVVDQYMAQLVPNTESTNEFSYETGNALAALLDKIGPAVVMGHSQGGRYVMTAQTLRPKLMKGVILVEAACVLQTVTNPTEIGVKLGKATLLNVYGDYISQHPFWVGLDRDCETIANQVNTNGGDATHLRLPTIGIKGNDHMMMMDSNSKQIAGVMMDWIEKHASKKGGRDDDDHGHGGHDHDDDHDHRGGGRR
jgi:pimeloyl-ACP methyl ester carboxylesterase